MNKKKQKNQAALAAIAMLLISAIVITTASFAWFTLGRSAQVEELDLKVTKQGEGIAISANASKFTDTITYANLKGTATDDSATTSKNEADYNAISEDFNHFTERISPASSEFKTGLPAFFAGGIDRVANTMVAQAATSADGTEINEDAGFYAFDVFVKNGGDSAIKVKMGSSKIIVDAATAAEDTADDKGDENYYDETVKAMRIGFVNCGTVTEGSTAKATSGTPAAIYADASSSAEATLPVNGAGESAEIDSNAYTVPAGKEGTLSLASAYGVSVDKGTENITMELQPGVSQIRVYIWMEGQDENCTDSLMSQYIKANVVFSIV